MDWDQGSYDSGLSGTPAARLKFFVERVERIQEDIDGLNDDKKEVYAEARGTGFDVKIMKLVIKRRAMETQALREQDELLEMYERALEESSRAGARTHAREEAGFDAETGEVWADDHSNTVRSPGVASLARKSPDVDQHKPGKADPLTTGDEMGSAALPMRDVRTDDLAQCGLVTSDAAPISQPSETIGQAETSSCGSVDGHAAEMPSRTYLAGGPRDTDQREQVEGAAGIEPGPQETQNETAEPIDIESRMAEIREGIEACLANPDNEASFRARQAAIPDIPDFMRRAPAQGGV